MLSKQICKCCIDKNRKRYGPNVEDGLIDWKWGKGDDVRWKFRTLCCVSNITLSGVAYPFDVVPEWCPYELEHLMEAQEKC